MIIAYLIFHEFLHTYVFSEMNLDNLMYIFNFSEIELTINILRYYFIYNYYIYYFIFILFILFIICGMSENT